MSEFEPVRTAAELDALDHSDVYAGYWAGLMGETSEPGSDKSRAYWHGWRNAMVDCGHAQPDSAQDQLAREIVGTYKGLH